MPSTFPEILNSQLGISALFFIAGCAFTILVSYIFFRKSQKSALLVYDWVNIEVISLKDKNLYDEIIIMYKENKIENIDKLLISIWNYGHTTIRNVDVVVDDKLRLVFEKSINILSYRIISSTKSVNGFSLQSHNNTEIVVDFNYIGPLDGIVIEVIYSGDTCIPIVTGTFIDIEKGMQSYHKMPINKILHVLKLSLLFLLIGIFAFVTILVMKQIEPFLESKNMSFFIIVTMIIMFVLAGLVLPKIATVIMKNRRYPNILDIEEQTNIYSRRGKSTK